MSTVSVYLRISRLWLIFNNTYDSISYNSYTQTLDIRVMPTFIHDVHQSWLVMEMPRMVLTGFVTQEEFDSVSFLVGTSMRIPPS